MSEKEVPCSRCGGDIRIPARYNADNIAKLEAENKWMRREVERVGHAIYTGNKGYVGTEEDLQAIGQSVEGICETLERMPELEAVMFAAKSVVDDAEGGTFDKMRGYFDVYTIQSEIMTSLQDAITDLENLTTPTK